MIVPQIISCRDAFFLIFISREMFCFFYFLCRIGLSSVGTTSLSCLFGEFVPFSSEKPFKFSACGIAFYFVFFPDILASALSMTLILLLILLSNLKPGEAINLL